MAGSWTDLNNQPDSNIDTMLLLTDGGVMCHEFSSKKWHKLTPPDSGDYRDGQWTDLESLPDNANIPTSFGGPTNAPLFFASAVLADGRVFTAGGEYNSTSRKANDSLAAQIYDPRTHPWMAVSTPNGWTGIGDGVTCVLPDGRLMLGQFNGSAVAIYDPDLDLWTFTSAKGDSCSEETFTLLGDDTVLTVQCSNANNAEKYLIATDQWVSAGTTPSPLPQPCPGQVAEIGPALLLPSGKVFAVGATGNTAIFDPTQPVASAWTAGPSLKDKANKTSFPMDAPGVLLPNGKVLLVGGPKPPCKYPGPSTFFEYNPATNKAPVVAGPSDPSRPPFQGRFLLLPTGEVLYSNNTSKISIYKPDGSPNASWKPTITSAHRPGARPCLHDLWYPAERAVAGSLLRRRRADGHELPAGAADEHREPQGQVPADSPPLDDGRRHRDSDPYHDHHGPDGHPTRAVFAGRGGQRHRLRSGDGPCRRP